ncbi:hypothetical protein ABGB18_31820 [Nonomuraea sp. B12E4]|uniref:hypothetical protein n=1 Tax=Nonomuraea sp. B12E4 TaxID=3153564 RepID=UPI00325C9DCA
MSGYALVFVVLFPLILLPFAINPRLGWTLSRWQYANPDANEPSEAAFAFTRFMAILAMIICVAVGLWMYFSTRNLEEKFAQDKAEWAAMDKESRRETEFHASHALGLVRNADGGQILGYWALPKAKKLTVFYRPSPCNHLLYGAAEEDKLSVTIEMSEETTLEHHGDPCPESSSGEKVKTKAIDLRERLGTRVLYTTESSQPIERCDDWKPLSELCEKASKQYVRERPRAHAGT